MKKYQRILWILSGAIWVVASHASTCFEAFRNLNQKDKEFLELGLIQENHSMICGPVCVVSLLEGSSRQLGLPPTHSNPHQEVYDLVRRLAPQVRKGLDSEIIKVGTEPKDLLKLTRVYFSNRGIKVHVELQELWDMRFHGKLRSFDENIFDGRSTRTSMLLMHSFPVEREVIEVFKNPSKELWRSHYVILSKVEKVNGDWIGEVFDTDSTKIPIQLIAHSVNNEKLWEVKRLDRPSKARNFLSHLFVLDR